MNKLLQKVAKLTLGLAMAAGVGVAVSAGRKDVNEVNAATTTTVSWTAKCGGSGTGTGGESWTVTSDASESNWESDRGIHYGTSSAAVTYIQCQTSGITGTVTEIVVNCSGNNSPSLSATVGGTNLSAVKTGITTSNAAYTFSGSQSASSTKPIVVKIYKSSKAKKALYIKSIAVTYETGGSFGTLDHIKVTTPASKTSFEVGETFSSSGLVLTGYDAATEATANTQTYSSGYTTNYDSHTFVAGDIGASKTVTVTYSGKTTNYTIAVTAAPDFTHTYSSNSVYNQTSGSTSVVRTYTPTSGPEYVTLGGYNYSGNGGCMSFMNSAGMYLGNNEEYTISSAKKYISKIVITTYADYSSSLTMTEGPVALSTATTITPSKSADNKTLTYTFSGSNAFFKLSKSGTSYVNLTSIKVYLGNTIEDAVVDSVEIATPGSVYVGKTLTLVATVHYTNKSDDHNVTWRVSSGSGATVSDAGVVTANAATATTIEAKSVEKNSGGNQVAATVTITPLANPFTTVTFDTSSAKTKYNIGDSLDITGITATGTRASGDDEAITLTASNFSGFDSSDEASDQEITITYETWSTTYSIDIVAAPDIELLGTTLRNSASYGDGSQTVGGITFNYTQLIGNANYMQIAKNNYGFYNDEDSPLGLYIKSIEVKVRTNSVNIYVGTSELSSSSGAAQSKAVSSGDAVTFTPTNHNNQYLRIETGSSYAQVDYVYIWYAPFVPTVTLDETSFEFTEGASEDIEVNATASYFTNNSGVVFTASSSDQDVLDNGDITVSSSKVTISKADINPGETTVTVTGTYSAASEVATATFSITCNAAARNLLSIAKTTSSSDVEFEKGGKFTITDLVITGTFDKAPLTADVTSECTFKLWDGSSETALTPNSTTLNTAGSFTVRISHASSAAAETLTYSITVTDPQNIILTADVLGSFAYEDTKTSEFNISLNANLDSSIDVESHGLYKNNGMQMNTGKGTYIKNTIAVPGRILRIEMTWSASGKNSPTVYFGNSYIDESPETGGTKADATLTSQVITATGDKSYFYLDGTTVTGSCVMTEFKVVYLRNVDGEVQNFADKYLHMIDYTSQEGYCMDDSDQHYYSDAKDAYGDLTVEQKTAFANNSSAVARLQAWARANGETFDPSAKTFSANPRVSLVNIIGENTNTVAIIVIISMVSVTAIGGYFFLRKRKENI